MARVARVAQAKRRPVQYAGKEWSGPECCSEMLRKTAFQATSNLKQGAGGCFQVFLNAYFPSYRYLPKYTIQVSKYRFSIRGSTTRKEIQPLIDLGRNSG